MSANKKIDSDPDGREAVETWLDNIPADQQRVARRVDRLIFEAVPNAVSGVKYRKPSQPLGVPFYGLPGGGWIVSVNSLKSQVRLNFFAGLELEPMPPLATPPKARGIDYRSEDEIDEKQLKSWLRQARKLPGWGRV
jgi:hypothetical protein